ncbi:hypothetical protein [Bacillus sp. FJAT-44742]|uniref:hypothetical protein n=1 Tax=Bacillus sp. FJAT-44742 TaxID=2014005 RepID=UPI000C236237|nr:hypothetical protein [Bacillus sp. FJAT-44742]
MLDSGENRIGEMAKRHNLKDYSIQKWCDDGLVNFRWDEEFGRVIKSEEDKKIQRIKEIKKEKGQKTSSETIRRMLIQEGLIKEQTNLSEIKSSGMQKSMENALEEIGVKDILLTLAEHIHTIPTKEDILKLGDNQAEFARIQSDLEKEKEKADQLKQIEVENRELRKENAELKSRLETLSNELESLKEDYKEVALKKKPMFAWGSKK